MRLTSVSAILRLWLAEPCLSTILYPSILNKSSAFVVRFKLRYTPHVLGVYWIGLPLLALFIYFSALYGFVSLVTIGFSHLCWSVVALFRLVFYHLRSLYIMSTCFSCTFSSARRFIGGVVFVLVQDEMNIMFTRKPKSYSIVIPCLTELPRRL